MTKRISFILIIAIFTFSFLGNQTKAASDYSGKVVKMKGLSSLYYVADDGKRYVFPNENAYKSWFTGYNDVTTLSESDLTALPLGGNVLYRPGVLLIKITTDPKVYAVSKGGVLRWVTTEAIAKALYGDNWNKLVDDVADSFFTNYKIGSSINSTSDFDPNDEANDVDNIDTNLGFSSAVALRAQTRKCQITNNARECRSTSTNSTDTTNSNDTTKPYITKINITNGGAAGHIDSGDIVTITFNEAINPTSINSGLTAGGYVNSLSYDINGAVGISSTGLLTVNNIADFDIGEVEGNGQFAVKLALNSTAKVLTVTLLSGTSIGISDEDFNDAKQIGGTVKDQANNVMENDSNIGEPDGTFGGVNTNDGVGPYITSIKIYNNGDDNYIDSGDQIQITFSEEIKGGSINTGLNSDGTVNGSQSSKTGGVTLTKGGIMTVINIASFYVGKVGASGSFNVNLSLNSTGRILTITLADGDDISLTNEDLDDAAQIGGTVKDVDNNRMNSDPNITDPTGSFIGESTNADLYISSAKVYNGGYVGYIDEGDKIVITFNREVSNDNLSGYVEADETGGAKVNSNGLFVITDVMSFDMGEVAKAGEFETNLSLSSNKKVLTITLFDGDAVSIKSESFGKITQAGGYVLDENKEITMKAQSNIDAPDGTFGGDSVDNPPYITQIKATNGGTSGHIDTNDRIEITFSKTIDPASINNGLTLGHSVSNVDNDDTGGVNIGDNGILEITDIAKFSVGSVSDNSEFKVKLAINSLGNVLTITLDSGDDITLNYQDLDDAEQIGGILKDSNNKAMVSDPSIDDPDGSF